MTNLVRSELYFIKKKKQEIRLCDSLLVDDLIGIRGSNAAEDFYLNFELGELHLVTQILLGNRTVDLN